MSVTVTWFGHSNFKVQSDELTVIIDPFFEGNPTAPLSADEAGKPDLVLLTHDHPDHSGQAIEICKASGASLVGVYDTVTKLHSMGLPEGQGIGMNIGGTVMHNGVAINQVQAVHSSASGVASGYVLTYPDGFCLYHAGDTALYAGMELTGMFHSIDLALLPVGGHFTMDVRAAAYACKLLKARKAVPMHWGTFPILDQDPTGFGDQLDEIHPQTGMVVMQPGEPKRFAKGGLVEDCQCE